MPIINQDVAFIPVSLSLVSTTFWYLIAMYGSRSTKSSPPRSSSPIAKETEKRIYGTSPKTNTSDSIKSSLAVISKTLG